MTMLSTQPYMQMATDLAPITIGEAKAQYLTYKRSKVGLLDEQGLSLATYNSIRTMLDHVLTTLDQEQPICTLKRKQIEEWKDGWMRLVAQGKITKPTAIKYCMTMKAFLNWADFTEDIDYEHPKHFQQIFRFRNRRTHIIRDYDPALVRSILRSLDDKHQLFVLMALTLGYYQVDIARLSPSMIRILNDDTYIVRVREKISRISNEENWHHVAPEVAARMKQHQSTNPDLYFTNQRGASLQSVKNARPSCNISTNYARAMTKAHIDFPFKQFRKLGATWIHNNFDQATARLYLAHVVTGMDANYLKNDYVKRLTPALKAWAEQLRKDGLFDIRGTK